MMDFGAPVLLVMLVAVPLVAAAIAWGSRRRRQAIAQFAGSGMSRLRSAPTARARRAVKIVLLLGGVTLLAAAAALPQHGHQHLILPRQGSDVVLAVDVSRSMGVQDVQPSRLDHAKQAADALIDHLAGDRVALVVFAGSAAPRFPLTTDLAAARQVVDSMAILDGGVKGGTDLVAALTTANETLKGDQTRSKVVVIISDGEDLAGSDMQAAARAGAAGLTIETIGVGTQTGGQVFATNPASARTTPVIDPDTGQTAVSHRDDGNLRQLAAAGHGSAYEGNSTDFAFVLSGAIDRLEPTRFASGNATIPYEYFQVPLAAALVLLLVETLITEDRRRRRAATPASTSEQEPPLPAGARNAS
jgi:Ca-activated chloride channel family protein